MEEEESAGSGEGSGLNPDFDNVILVYFLLGEKLETALVPKDSSSDDIKGTISQ
jgi:hypothetical protein